MKKTLFGSLMIVCAVCWGKSASEEVTYGELRPRLLLKASEDVYLVEAMPELVMPKKDASIPLKFTEYLPKRIKKDRLYRVSYVDTFDAPNHKDPNNKAGRTIYNVRLLELNDKMQPFGEDLNLGARAIPVTKVSNFKKIKDVLSGSPTLKTGRAAVGDYIINAFPQELNGRKYPAYTKFQIIGIEKEYVPFTLSFRYKLQLKNLATNGKEELSATGLRSLHPWALVTAPGNERVIKFKFGELHY